MGGGVGLWCLTPLSTIYNIGIILLSILQSINTNLCFFSHFFPPYKYSQKGKNVKKKFKSNFRDRQANLPYIISLKKPTENLNSLSNVIIWNRVWSDGKSLHFGVSVMVFHATFNNISVISKLKKPNWSNLF